MTRPGPERSGVSDGGTEKQHGDPLLDAAQGRGDGSDASRHGVGHGAGAGSEEPAEDAER